MEHDGELKDQDVFLKTRSGLDSAWVAGIKDEKEKKEFKEMLAHSGKVFGKLRTIIKEMYTQAQFKAERGLMESPNWAENVAFQMGYQRALRDVYSRLPKTTKE